MAGKKETIYVIISIVLMSIILIFQNNAIYPEKLLESLIISTIIILTFVFSKKLMAKKLDSKVTMDLWFFQRYFILRKSYLPKPIPAGILFPLLLSFLSTGIVKFLAFLVFTAEALPSKVSKRYGRYRFASVTDWDYALIAFYSLFSLTILTVLSIVLAHYTQINFDFLKLAKISFYFMVSNFLIPISPLDGTKIFFGSRPLYILSLILLALTGIVAFS